jgi:hypothetical protein
MLEAEAELRLAESRRPRFKSVPAE